MQALQPLVTIITPAFNQADFLAETIDSVLAQSWPLIEYVVVDDGSTDRTAEVITGYAGRLEGRSQKNRGQARTLNEGWAQARGKYLAYLSSDDVLYPEAIEKLVAVLEADSGLVCAFPDADLIDESSAVVRRGVCRPFDIEALVIEQECYIGPGAVFSREAFERTGGWRPELKLAPDREFWMRLSREGGIHFLKQSLAGYRVHPGSISYKVVSEKASMEYIRVLDDYFAQEISPAIAGRKDEAYARAHFLIARNCYRGGDFARGSAHYAKARSLHPPLGSLRAWLIICRTVLSKPVRATIGRIRRVLKN